MKKIIVLVSVMLMGVVQITNAQNANVEYNINKIASVVDKATSVGEFSEGFLNVCIDGKWGYVNFRGEAVTPFEYSFAKPFSSGMAKVEKDGQGGFVNTNGQYVTNEHLMGANDFHDGLAVTFNGQYGIVNKQGRLVVPYQPNIIEDYKDGMALVYVDRSKYGAYNINGQLIIPAKYDGMRNFSSGLACAQIESDHFYVRKNGARLQPSTLINGEDFKDNIATVETNEGRGFMDSNGRIVVFQSLSGFGEDYCEFEDFSEGLAVVHECALDGEPKKGYMNKLGKIVISTEYDEAYAFSNGMAKVAKNGHYGFVSADGRLVVNCIYDDAIDYSDGIGIVKQNEKYGYINKQGKLIGKIDFDEAQPFSYGIAKVMRGGKYGFIDKNGRCTLNGGSNASQGENSVNNVVSAASDYEMPIFKGGDVAMKQYFKNNVRYPAIADEQGLEGDVYVLFGVDLDGSIYKVRIAKSTEKIFEKEAKRLVKSMPRWEWKSDPNSNDIQILIHFSIKGTDATIIH